MQIKEPAFVHVQQSYRRLHSGQQNTCVDLACTAVIRIILSSKKVATAASFWEDLNREPYHNLQIQVA